MKKVAKLPVKQNKQKQRVRYFTYLVLSTSHHTWLQKRNSNDIWKNLFEFPLIETTEKTEPENLLNLIPWMNTQNKDLVTVNSVSKWKIHLLSHQRINYRFIHFVMPEEFELHDKFMKVNKEDIFNFAVPKLIESYLNGFGENL